MHRIAYKDLPPWLRAEADALARAFAHLPHAERGEAIVRNLSERARRHLTLHALFASGRRAGGLAEREREGPV